MRGLITLLCLSLASLVSAQVVVLTGKDVFSIIGGGETRKISAPLVLIIDLSPAADPANYITVLVVETRSDGKELECQNLSEDVMLFTANGARGSKHLGMAIMGLDIFGADEAEGEFLLLSGQIKTIKLGKGLANLDFVTTLKGPRGFFFITNSDNDEIETGTVSFRLDTKSSKTANTLVGGVAPSFASTLASQRAALAKKYKIPADRIGICD